MGSQPQPHATALPGSPWEGTLRHSPFVLRALLSPSGSREEQFPRRYGGVSLLHTHRPACAVRAGTHSLAGNTQKGYGLKTFQTGLRRVQVLCSRPALWGPGWLP